MSSGFARIIEQLRAEVALESHSARFAAGHRVGAAGTIWAHDNDDIELGGIRPTLPGLKLEEAAWMLQGLFLVNLAQLKRGVKDIDPALRAGRVKYIRDDKAELWEPISVIWQVGGGDCEDLAAAIAASLVSRGIAARPVIYRVKAGLAHAVVQILDPRYANVSTGTLFGHPVIRRGIIDPSRTGGMGR